MNPLVNTDERDQISPETRQYLAKIIAGDYPADPTDALEEFGDEEKESQCFT